MRFRHRLERSDCPIEDEISVVEKVKKSRRLFDIRFQRDDVIVALSKRREEFCHGGIRFQYLIVLLLIHVMFQRQQSSPKL